MRSSGGRESLVEKDIFFGMAEQGEREIGRLCQEGARAVGSWKLVVGKGPVELGLHADLEQTPAPNY